MNAQINNGPFADFNNLILDILAGFGNNFFDSCRVNAAILNEPVKRQAGYFPANRVESRNNDRFGGVVYNDFNTRCGFQSPYVAAFTPNYFPFYIVGLDIEHRHAVFDSMFGCGPLNGFDNDFFCLFGGGQFGFFNDAFDVGRGPAFGFGFLGFDQLVASLISRETCNFFKLSHLVGQHPVGFLLTPFYLFFPFVEGINLLGEAIFLLIYFVPLLI